MELFLYTNKKIENMILNITKTKKTKFDQDGEIKEAKEEEEVVVAAAATIAVETGTMTTLVAVTNRDMAVAQ